jgi:hypothetical protein
MLKSDYFVKPFGTSVCHSIQVWFHVVPQGPTGETGSFNLALVYKPSVMAGGAVAKLSTWSTISSQRLRIELVRYEIQWSYTRNFASSSKKKKSKMIWKEPIAFFP